jgi:hypothetical protein
MKKIIASILAVVAASVLTPLLHAQERGGFVGLNYVVLDQHDRFFGGDRFDTGDLYLRVGANISRYFGSELRVGSTILEEENAGNRFRNEYFITGLLKLQKDIGPLTPYLGVGYSTVKERSPSGTYSLNDWSYAVGVDFSLGDRLGINGEIFVLGLDSDPDNNIDRKGPSVGIFYRF